MTDRYDAMAETLYEHHNAGLSRDQAPAWIAAAAEVRDHWRRLARFATALVRDADEAGQRAEEAGR